MVQGVGVGFGKISNEKVGCAIRHSKGICTHTILIKTVLNYYCHPYVQGSSKCKNIETKNYCIASIPNIRGLSIIFPKLLITYATRKYGV